MTVVTGPPVEIQVSTESVVLKYDIASKVSYNEEIGILKWRGILFIIGW